MVYSQPIDSFEEKIIPSEVYQVNIMEGGRKALAKINTELGRL